MYDMEHNVCAIRFKRFFFNILNSFRAAYLHIEIQSRYKIHYTDENNS